MHADALRLGDFSKLPSRKKRRKEAEMKKDLSVRNIFIYFFFLFYFSIDYKPRSKLQIG